MSLRTIYRDMATLMASGLPVEGERGVGYARRAPIAMAPAALNDAEQDPLSLAMALMQGGASPETARLNSDLARKLAQASGSVAVPEQIDVHAPAELKLAMAHLARLREAIRARERLAIRYKAPGKPAANRIFRPLHLEFWGQTWTCGGWCELREDFRVLRADRILTLAGTGTRFRGELGRNLADYLKSVGPP